MHDDISTTHLTGTTKGHPMPELPRRLTIKLPPLTDEQYATVANTVWAVVQGLARSGSWEFEAVPDGRTSATVLDHHADLDNTATRWGQVGASA
jgi:hypothetical protein